MEALINKFMAQGAHASDFREEVEAEAEKEGKDPQDMADFKELQGAASKRNTFAYLIGERCKLDSAPLESIYGKGLKEKIEHYQDRFEASFQAEKGLKSSEGIGESLASFSEKYDALASSSLILQRHVQIESTLENKGVQECLDFEGWRDLAFQRNALAYHLHDSLKKGEKDPEDFLSEKALQHAEKFEKVFEAKPLIKEVAKVQDEVLTALTERYEKVDGETLQAWKEALLESAIEDKPFEECMGVSTFFSLCAKRNALAFSLQLNLSQENPSHKELFEVDKLTSLARQAESFERTLQKPEIFLNQDSMSCDLKDLSEKYTAKVQQTLELKRAVASEVGKTGLAESACPSFEIWQKECQKRNALSSELLSSIRAEEIKPETLLTPSALKKVLDQAERFERAFEARVLFKEGLQDKEIPLKYHQYENLFKHSQTLRKIIVCEAAVQGIEEKDSAFFEEWQDTCRQRNETAFFIREKLSERTEIFTKEGHELQTKHAERFDESFKPYVVTQGENSPHKDEIEAYQNCVSSVLELRKEAVLADQAECDSKYACFSAVKEAVKERNLAAHNLKALLESKNIDLEKLFTERGLFGLILHEQKHFEALEKEKDLYEEDEILKHDLPSLKAEEKALLDRLEERYKSSIKAQKNLLKEVQENPGKKVYTLSSFKGKVDAEKKRNALATAVSFKLKESQLEHSQIFNVKGERLVKSYIAAFEKSFKEVELLKKGAPLTKDQETLLNAYSTISLETSSLKKEITLESALSNTPETKHPQFEALKNHYTQKNALAWHIQEKFGQEKIETLFTEKGRKMLNTQSQKEELKMALEASKPQSPMENKGPLEHKKLAARYYKCAARASELREIVEVERAGNSETSESSHYKEWQKVCAKRNEAAYQLKTFASKEEIKGVFKEKSIYYLETQAKKHEEILKAQEERVLRQEKRQDLDNKLSTNIDSLLYKLFPDGPSSKTAKSYRFGAKGSLTITHSGPKAGQFYDFENQEGGSLLKLIGRELQLDKQQSCDWAKEFLGIANEIKIPKTFQKPSAPLEKESDWVSVKPDPNIPAPMLEDKGKLHYYFNETMRHAYRDREGNLLYYVTRLQDKKDPTKKMTPPLSYGYFKDNPEELSWQRRGYKDENGKTSLYGLEKLNKNPNAVVVIVEGEKAADLGAEKFLDKKGHICLSWAGGVNRVSKADWSQLEGRKVLVWGDHDTPGQKAQLEVCQELKKLSAVAVKAIDHKMLEERNFPEKWDLADPLPEEKSDFSIQIIKDGAEKIIGNFHTIDHQLEKELGIDKDLDKGLDLDL